MPVRIVATVVAKPGEEEAFATAARDLCAGRPDIIVTEAVDVA